MSSVRRFSYTEPELGLDGQHASAQLDISTHDDGDGSVTTIVHGSTGRETAKAAITGPADDVVNGRRTSFRAGLEGAWLTANEAIGQTLLSVDDSSGFADGDPIAIFNASADGVPTSPEYGIVDGTPPSGTTLEVNIGKAAGGLIAAKYKGARIVNLAGVAFDVAVGIDGRPGVKSQLEAPSPVTIAIAEDSGEITVTITANDEDEATHYDTYVRESRFRHIEPGWVPDDADRTTAAAFNVTTFEGGANCVPDGGGGALVSGNTYYVAVVTKNGAGVRDVDESLLSNVEAITLA